MPFVSEGGNEESPAKVDSRPLAAGEHGYIRNWGVSPEAVRGGWYGENVIYLGDGKYYGHPFGIATGETIVKFLNQHHVPNSK